MPHRRHEDVVRALLSRILSGEFAAGDLLPKEVDLAWQYDVSRGTAREALRALEERRVAIVRRAIVQPQSAWNVLDPTVANALLTDPRSRRRFARELAESLAAVEAEVAGLAARRARTTELRRLEDP
jgi:GntR family transcriptional regulator, galactonate operon transcriptional repressor